MTHVRLIGAAMAALAMSGCLDDTPTAATPPGVRATLSANVVGEMAGGTVRIRVAYRTNTQTLVTLPSNPAQVTLAAGATVVVPVTVDIGRCLKDRQRALATTRGCQLTIELTLSDATGETVDEQSIDAPKPATPGATVDFGSITIGARVSTITVAPASVTANVSQDQQLTATVRDLSGAVVTTPPLTWTTSDATVVQIGAVSGQSVTIRPLKLGVATVTATAGRKTSNAVSVNVVPPTPLTLRQRPAAGCIIAGQTVTLDVDTPPAAIAWSSANPAIATVNPTTGVVTGVVAGETTITATSGIRTGTATVCVIGPFVVTPSSLTIVAARTAQLTVSNSVGATLSYVSSAGSVASVSSSGVIHAITIGQTTITTTVVAASGTITLTTPVTVNAGSVDISPTSATASVDGTSRYGVVVRDGDGGLLADVAATWTIDDPSIGTLSVTAGPMVDVRATKIGTTTVRAAVPGGSASASFTVTAALPAVRLEKVSGDDAVPGPVANYVQVLTLNRTVTPAALTLAFDESQLPFGNYVLDITVSTTTPGIGTGGETIVFTPAPSGFSTSNAPRRQDLRRASVALRAP